MLSSLCACWLTALVTLGVTTLPARATVLDEGAAVRAAAPPSAPQNSAPSAHAQSRAASVVSGWRRLDDSMLAARRAGADSWSEMKLKGVVADNQAINVVTGSNIISEGALAGAAGLPMVIQNSGNNVLIQNATIVNVQVK